MIDESGPVRRQAMLVLELVDPVTGLPTGAAMQSRLDGWAKPVISGNGQHVWNYPEHSNARRVKIETRSTDNRYAPYTVEVDLPAWTEDARPKRHHHVLQPTGLYVPPAGRLAIGGMLVTVVGRQAAPIAKAEVRLVLDGSIAGSTLRSDLLAITDERGGFVAMARGFGDEVPPPAVRPHPDGTILARLEIAVGSTTKLSKATAIPRAGLTYLNTPLAWTSDADFPP